jgi:hypothetical protein
MYKCKRRCILSPTVKIFRAYSCFYSHCGNVLTLVVRFDIGLGAQIHKKPERLKLVN